MQFDLLQTALKTTNWQETKAKDELLKSLPLWIKWGVEIYEMDIGKDGHIYIVAPKKKLEFDQLRNIVASLEKKLKKTVLLVADDLPSKYRSLFVREGVPFILKFPKFTGHFRICGLTTLKGKNRGKQSQKSQAPV